MSGAVKTPTDAEIASLTKLGNPARVRRDALIAMNLNGTYSARRVHNARQRIAADIADQHRSASADPVLEMNAISLEDWAPGQPDEQWRAVRVVERYSWDGRTRLRVELLEGPERGRVVSGLSESNLRPRVSP